MPAMTPLVRNAMILLCATYGVEMVLRYLAGMEQVLARLALHPTSTGLFEPHQLLTHYLVLGSAPFALFVSLIAVYFLLQPMLDRLGPRALLFAALSSAAGGSLLAGLGALVGHGEATGYDALVMMLLPLFGLAMPNQVVRLFFVLPVQASWVTWGYGVIAFLVAATLDLSGLEQLGCWAGLLAWWFGAGPGAHRRRLKAKARSIEKELQRFQVIEGGKADDDWVH